MRITPSISLSWTIEREIDSEECREDEPNDEEPGEEPGEEDFPFPPNRPDMPPEINEYNCGIFKPGWYIIEIHRGTYFDNSTKVLIDNPKKAYVDNTSDWPYPEDRPNKYWIKNPSLKPSRVRYGSENNHWIYGDLGYVMSWIDRIYFCYDEAREYTQGSTGPGKVLKNTDYLDTNGARVFDIKYETFHWEIHDLSTTGRQFEYAYVGIEGTALYTRHFLASYKVSLYPQKVPLLSDENSFNKPIGYPKMSKKCCSDPKLMKMVKEIYDVLDPKEIKKSSIPRRFLAIDGEGTEKLKTYNEIFQALFLMLDKQGYIPFSVKKETADGDEIGLDFKHQSQALHAIIGHLINMDQDTQETEQIKQLDRKYGEVTARLALAICQILSTSIHTNEMCYAILQFLGFKTTDSYDNVPTSLDPISLKEFSDIDIDTESNPDEFNDRIMAILFSDSELKVPAIKMSDQKTLQTALLELKLLLTKPVQTTK